MFVFRRELDSIYRYRPGRPLNLTQERIARTARMRMVQRIRMSGRQSAIAWRRTMRHLVSSPRPLPSMNPANSTPPAPESCRPPVAATQGGSFILELT